MHYAAFFGHLDCIKILLDHPTIIANPSSSGFHKFPINYALNNAHPEVVEYLLSHPLTEITKTTDIRVHSYVTIRRKPEATKKIARIIFDNLSKLFVSKTMKTIKL